MAITRINGTSGNDKKIGTSANEAFYGGTGNDDFDGAGGTDTALYLDQFSDFTISTVNGITMVKHRDNQETTWDGNDKLTNVERLEFSDKTVFLTPNKGPVAGADSASGNEDTSIVIQASTLLGNDSDPDGDNLVISDVSGATHGTVTLSQDGLTITYTPDLNYFGAAEFTYTVKDVIKGAAASDILSASAKVSLTITAVNDAPVGTATAVLAAGSEDTAYTVSKADLLAGFTDVDAGDVLSVSGLTADKGVVTANADGSFTITPAANYNGLVGLSYNVIDGNGGVIAASQSFNLAAVNDAHTGGVSIAGLAKVGEVLTASNTLADVDGLGPITYHWEALRFGVWEEVGTGTTFTISPNFSLIDKTIHVVASYTDGGGTVEAETSAATAPVLTNNHAPDAVDDAFTITEDFPNGDIGSLFANDTDADGDALQAMSWKLISPTALPNGTGMSVYGNGVWGFSTGGNYDYLAAGESTQIKIEYVVRDVRNGEYLLQDQAQATLTIMGVNDVASISGKSAGSFTEDAYNYGGITSGYLSVTDADHDQSAFKPISPTDLHKTYGDFTFSTDGAWSYRLNNSAANVQALNSGQAVHDTLTVTSLDGTANQTIDITINGVDEPRPQTLVTFEDLSGQSLISNGYAGFNWSNVYSMPGTFSTAGYYTGVIGNMDAFNGYGESATISRGTNFDFESGYFTAAWTNDLRLEIQGYDDHVFKGSQTVAVNTYSKTFVHLDDAIFNSVDEVRFVTSSATYAATQAVFDNLLFM